MAERPIVKLTTPALRPGMVGLGSGSTDYEVVGVGQSANGWQVRWRWIHEVRERTFDGDPGLEPRWNIYADTVKFVIEEDPW